MWNKIFPGLRWLQGYNGQLFKSDMFSGITIAVMLIPQGMAYALVAGLPPEYGLYACIFPPIVYAMLGTSNKISIGPVALDSILIITGLSLLAQPGSERYLQLAIMLTLMVGLLQCLWGLMKLGFVANFLSYPVIVGYTSAAALTIMVSQLPNVMGVAAEGSNVFELLYQLLQKFSQWQLLSLALAGLGMGFMIYPKKFFPGLPYALLLLVLGMLAAGFWGLQNLGLAVVDQVPQGLPSLSLPQLSQSDFFDLLSLAITVAIMGYVGTMSICKAQQKPGDKIATQPNQELLAVGLANVLGAFLKCFPVSASFSRSAAFRQSGALTQVSALVSSLLILLVVLFLTPLFTVFPLPKVLLAVVIIVSVSGLFKYREMISLYRHSRREFYILLTTFMVTLLLGIQQGLLIGIALSIFLVIYKTARPHMTELGAIEGGRLFRNIHRFTEAEVRPEVLIFRFDAPLYFANTDYFLNQLYGWLRARPAGQLKFVVFDAEAVSSIDSTGLLMLEQLIESLEQQGICLCLTNVIGPVRDAIGVSSLQNYICKETMFSSVHDALLYIDSGVSRHARQALQTNV